MKPKINSTKFGSITIAGERYEYDVYINLQGEVKKRKKKLSKEIYGTSHTISLPEAQHVYQSGVKKIIIGTGQVGMVELSKEAAEFLKKLECQVMLYPTPEAIEHWNQEKGAVIGLFHVTC